MQNDMAPGASSQLAKELKGLWNEPTTAKCRRLSRDAQSHQQTAQLDTWEDEGGTSAPRERI